MGELIMRTERDSGGITYRVVELPEDDAAAADGAAKVWWEHRVTFGRGGEGLKDGAPRSTGGSAFRAAAREQELALARIRAKLEQGA